MSRLGQIESHLMNQNMKWQNMDKTLQNQNIRMSHIEQQVKELNCVKKDVTKTLIIVSTMQDDIGSMSRKINEYDYSINTYCEMYDEALSYQTSAQITVRDLRE